MIRYWGGRNFDVFIDDEKLITEDNTGRWNQSMFIDIVYSIPIAMVKDKKHIRVKFQVQEWNTSGAVYGMNLSSIKISELKIQ